MKKTHILLTLLAVALASGFLFVSCTNPASSKSSSGSSGGGGSSSTGIPADLQGTWKHPQYGTVTITASSYTWTGPVITMAVTVTSATPKINTSNTSKTDYPSGYVLKGIITDTNISGNVTGVGQEYSLEFYLSADKQKFVSYEHPDMDNAAVYVKQ